MEIVQAFNWLEATMKADSALMNAATGGVWQGFADIKTATPYVIMTSQANSDVITMNAVRLFNNGTFQIKAVGPSSNFTPLATIADRIDALFGRTGPITLSQGGVLACWRESAYEYIELINGLPWSHLGGLYRIELQGS
jgi:hypothetical protein